MKRFNNNTKQLNILLKALIVFLIPIIAFFSMSFISINGIEKNAISNLNSKVVNKQKQLSNKTMSAGNDGLIIQTPETSYEWSKKLKKDLDSQKNYDPNLKYSFKYHGLSPNSNYLDPNHRYEAVVKVETYFRASWGAIFGDWGGLRLGGASFKLSNSGGSLDGTYNSKTYYSRGGKTAAGVSDSYKGSVTYTVPLRFSGRIHSYSKASKVSINLKFPEYNDVEDEGFFNVTNVELYDRSTGNKVFSKSPRLKWNTPTGGTGDNWRKMYASSKSFYVYDVYSQKYTDKPQYRDLVLPKIYMSENELNNKNWTTSELKKLIGIKYNNLNLINSANFSYIYLNKNTRTINTKLNVKISNTSYYDEKSISIPINVFNFNNLLETSVVSDPYWKHLPNGETQYYNARPKTHLKLSENYIRALYIAKGKQEVLNSLNTDNWGFIGDDKKIAIAKANSYALNIDNYQKVKSAYANSRKVNVISNLLYDHSLDGYIDKFKNISWSDYLYVLKNSKLEFDYGVKTFEKKSLTINNLYQGIDIKISDSEIRNLDKNRTNWSMHLKNFKVNVNSGVSKNFQNYLDIDLMKGNFKNYDLDLKYAPSTKKEVIHSYLFQLQGIDVSKNVSFITENGTILDQNFKVTKASSESNFKIGDYAYINIRYYATFKNGQQEYLTVNKNNGSWYSPKYKQNIKTIDPNFDEQNLEYLFNQNLQMIINPYQNSSGSKITASTPQSFGIKEVSDKANGVTSVLESWNDGRWSHTTDINGKAIFDGIFGADINGVFDYRGRLAEGKHHINIELQNSSFKGLKNSFYITVDKNPVKINVNSVTDPVKELVIVDDQSRDVTMYYSSGPINFEVTDTDIKAVEAKFIDHEGHWYDLPIRIKSKQVDGKWKLVVDSTIDYAGFVQIKIYDQANNFKTLYFWLSKDKSEEPNLNFDYSFLFDQDKRKLLGHDLKIFKGLTPLVISSPLVTDLQITKQVLNDGKWIDEKSSANPGWTLKDYDPLKSQDYNFGKPIDSTQSVLKYAGDELKPFVTKNADDQWIVKNKEISFTKKGLYKISLNTRLIAKRNIDYYIYIKEDGLKPVNLSGATKDETNFTTLPNKDGGQLEGIDKVTNVLKEIKVNFPNFLIKQYQVLYALPWYSEFNELISPSSYFKKEGKYKILIEDIFAKKYEYEILLLDKKITYIGRIDKKMTPLGTPDPEYLSPYKEQMIFEGLEWQDDWKEMTFTTNTYLQSETDTKLISSIESLFAPSGIESELITIQISNPRTETQGINFGVYLAVKKDKNNKLSAWMYSKSDESLNLLSNKKIIALISKLNIKKKDDSLISIFDDHNFKDSKIKKLDATWYRQALLLSAESNLTIKLDDDKKLDVTNEDYGLNKQNISFGEIKPELKDKQILYKPNFISLHLNENTEKDQSFYKGKNIWAYTRYEDEDHLIWERDEFIKEAMRNGLTWDQAKNFYKGMKLDPNWNGDIKKLNWNAKDWKDNYKKFLMNSGNNFKLPDYDGDFDGGTNKFKFKPNNLKSTNSNKTTLSIIFGVLGSLGTLLSAYIIFKRIKGSRIK